jgi:hypothetical protein
MFDPARTKLTIGSLDDDQLTVRAQYNPKEIDLAKQAGWKDFDKINGRLPASQHDIVDLEYTGSAARTMSLELLFDGYEERKSIEASVRALQRMASPRDEDSRDPAMLRPHLCVVAWGSTDFANFRCVIESIAVKYTAFSEAGAALRAVCQVKLKEARLRRELPGVIRYLTE